MPLNLDSRSSCDSADTCSRSVSVDVASKISAVDVLNWAVVWWHTDTGLSRASKSVCGPEPLNVGVTICGLGHHSSNSEGGKTKLHFESL